MILKGIERAKVGRFVCWKVCRFGNEERSGEGENDEAVVERNMGHGSTISYQLSIELLFTE